MKTWHDIIHIIQVSPDDDVLEMRLRVSPGDPNMSSLEQLIEIIEETQRRYGKRESCITIQYHGGEIQNMQGNMETSVTPINKEEVITIIVDYVLLNLLEIDRIYKFEQEVSKGLVEQGSKLELDPELPTKLKNLNQWPPVYPTII